MHGACVSEWITSAHATRCRSCVAQRNSSGCVDVTNVVCFHTESLTAFVRPRSSTGVRRKHSQEAYAYASMITGVHQRRKRCCRQTVPTVNTTYTSTHKVWREHERAKHDLAAGVARFASRMETWLSASRGVVGCRGPINAWTRIAHRSAQAIRQHSYACAIWAPATNLQTCKIARQHLTLNFG